MDNKEKSKAHSIVEKLDRNGGFVMKKKLGAIISDSVDHPEHDEENKAKCKVILMEEGKLTEDEADWFLKDFGRFSPRIKEEAEANLKEFDDLKGNPEKFAEKFKQISDKLIPKAKEINEALTPLLIQSSMKYTASTIFKSIKRPESYEDANKRYEENLKELRQVLSQGIDDGVRIMVEQAGITKEEAIMYILTVLKSIGLDFKELGLLGD